MGDRLVAEAMSQIFSESRRVKVPVLRRSSDADRFLSALGPDDTPSEHVVDPETGEVLMSPGDTKRKQAKQQYHQSQSDRMNPSALLMYFGKGERGHWDSLQDFERLFNVVYRDFSKDVDDPDYYRSNDYDVEFDYPAAIKRKDGKRMDEYDVDAVESFVNYFNSTRRDSPNLVVKAFARVGDSIVRPSVEFR